MPNNDQRFVCPVCGFPCLIDEPRSRNDVPSYEICRSCGFQFGVTDDNDEETYESWRLEWVRQGMPWATKVPPPEGWDPRKQLDDLLRDNA